MGKKSGVYYTRFIMRFCVNFGIALFFVWLLFNIQHWPYQDILSILLFTLNTVFWITALYEMLKFIKPVGATKFVWISGIILTIVLSFIVFVPVIFLLVSTGYARETMRRILRLKN